MSSVLMYSMTVFASCLMLCLSFSPALAGSKTDYGDRQLLMSNGGGEICITRVVFSRTEPFTDGDVVRFGAEIVNRSSVDAINVEAAFYLDGKIWESGTVSLGRGQSVRIWSKYLWMATSGSHTLIFTADGSSLSRSFTVADKLIVHQFPPQTICSGDLDVWGLSGVNSRYITPGIP